MSNLIHRTRTTRGERSIARRVASGEAGVSLIELLVALTIFGVVASGVAVGMGSALGLTRNNRNRSVAANLAAKEMDIVRSTEFTSLPLTDVAKNEAVTGVSYAILRQTSWVSKDGTSGVCGPPPGTALAFLRVLVTVTWPDMQGVEPVQSETILAPPIGAYDTGTGHLAVMVRDRDALPLDGITVTAVGPGGTFTQTTVDGCVFFVGLAPGNFDVSLNTTGFVDVQNEVNPVQLLAISAGSITSGEFVYDRSSTIDMSLVGLANYGVPDGLGGTVANTGLALGTQPFSGTGGATCNPVTAGATDDARVRESAATTNSGSETTMKVVSQNSNRNERTFIKFTLPAVPAGCQFATANLWLYQDTGSSGRTIQVYRSNSSWSESSITWNTQPATTGAAVTAPSSGSSGAWMTWPVSTLVSTMYPPGSNNGFVIKDSAESASSTARTQVYRSSENGSSSTRPQLVVTFSRLLPTSQGVTATPLFPYLNGYQVWGGTCQDADPEGVDPNTGVAYHPGAQRDAAVASNPAQSSSVTVPLKSVDVRVQLSDSTPAAGAAVVAYHDPDIGCTSGKVLDLGSTGIDGYVRVALPYGTWRFQVTSKTPVGSWPSALLSPTTTNPDSITVTVN